MKILLVEDDKRIVEFVKRGLEGEGYHVDVAGTRSFAMDAINQTEYAMVILDRMLPDGDGAEICQRLRTDNDTTPILLLTAMDAIEERVQGLRMGADDYLTKPFAFDELLARIEALIRRRPVPQDSNQTTLSYEDLTLDLNTKQALRGDETIPLTPKEFSLLAYLMNNAEKVVSRTDILKNVWGYENDPQTNIVDVCIRGLRLKVDENFSAALIQTVRGFGYKIGK